MKAPRLSLVCLTMTLLTACGSVDDDDGKGTHGCDVFYNSTFSSVDLTLTHSEARNCEMDHGPGQFVSTAATIYDNTAVHGTNDGDAIEFRMRAFDNYSFTSPWSGGSPLAAQKAEFFNWWYNSSTGEYERLATITYNYVAMGSPDYIENTVPLWSTSDLAKGVIEVTHADSTSSGM